MDYRATANAGLNRIAAFLRRPVVYFYSGQPQQHAGTGGADYGRPGRIPGSVCVPARNLVDRETGWFRPLADLRADFATVGALEASTVITYCGGGIAASGDAFVLHLLGQDSVQIYDASLQEWARSELPMETDTAVA